MGKTPEIEGNVCDVLATAKETMTVQRKVTAQLIRALYRVIRVANAASQEDPQLWKKRDDADQAYIILIDYFSERVSSIVDKYKGVNLWFTKEDAKNAAQKEMHDALIRYSTIESPKRDLRVYMWLCIKNAIHKAKYEKSQRLKERNKARREKAIVTMHAHINTEDPLETVILDEDIRKPVRRALQTLTPIQQRNLVLHYVYDMKYVDISAMFNVTNQAVSFSAAGAEERLRKVLRAQGILPPDMHVNDSPVTNESKTEQLG